MSAQQALTLMPEQSRVSPFPSAAQAVGKLMTRLSSDSADLSSSQPCELCRAARAAAGRRDRKSVPAHVREGNLRGISPSPSSAFSVFAADFRPLMK